MFPILIQTNFFAIHSLWIFIGIALIAGTYTIIHIGIKNGLKIQFLNEHSFKLIVWVIIGSRLAGIFENYQDYFSGFNIPAFLRLFYIWDRGLSLWGGALAFLIYFYLVCKKEAQDFWKWLDSLVPSGLIAMAIIDLGAFFDGINHGNETSLPWGVNFARPDIKYVVPIHPTQIYAFLYSTILAIGLIFLANHKKLKEKEITGIIGLIGITVFSMLRFLEEFVRGDDVLVFFGIRTPFIATGLALILSGVLLYLRYNGRSLKLPIKFLKKKS